MEQIEHTDGRGRKYKAYRDGESILIVGPPEDFVEEFGLPEPFATNLHNALYRRGIYTHKEAARKPNELIGALQETYRVDAQRLNEALFLYNQEVDHE